MTQTRPSRARAPPGPGDYVSSYRDAIKAPREVPKQQQFFSSTQRRSSDVDPLKLRSAPSYWKDPGPGAYNASSAFSRQSMSDPACSAFSSTQVLNTPASPTAALSLHSVHESRSPLHVRGSARGAQADVREGVVGL